MKYPDIPINSKNEDLLAREPIATLIARGFLNLQTSESFCVGLLGPWGCGKTSIVNMALEIIKEEQKRLGEEQLIVMHFEPWNFSTPSQIFSQFFIQLGSLIENKNITKAVSLGRALKKYGGTLLETIDTLGFFSCGGLQKAIEVVGTKLEEKSLENNDLSEQKKIIIDLLKKENHKILIIIDDIDRLSQEQIGLIFQLVASIAKFPNTRYLLIGDRALMAKALEKVQEGNGQEYLDKIIQMPIQVPPLNSNKLTQLLTMELAKITERYEEIIFNLDYFNKLNSICIAPFIKNIRDIKRLSNVVEFKIASISNEINLIDMVAISILELQYPEIYQWVGSHKAILTEFSFMELAQKVSMERNSALLEETNFIDKIKNILVSNGYSKQIDNTTQKILSFLSMLFPNFGIKIGKLDSSIEYNDLVKNKNIGCNKYFDRYFSLSLNDVSIKNSEIKDALFNWDENHLKNFLLKHYEQNTLEDFLIEIESQLSLELNESSSVILPPDRAQIFVLSLLRTLESVNKKDYIFLDWYLSTLKMIEDEISQLFHFLNSKEKVDFINKMISTADLSFLVVLSRILPNLYKENIIEKKNYEKIKSFMEEKSRSLLEKDWCSKHFFKVPYWENLVEFIKDINPDYIDVFLENRSKNNSDFIKIVEAYLAYFTTGKVIVEIRLQEKRRAYLSEEIIDQKIDNLKQPNIFLTLSKDQKNIIAAYYLLKREKRPRVEPHEVDRLVLQWQKEADDKV